MAPNCAKYLICFRSDKHVPFHTFQPSIVFHIGTNHLICPENQMTGFYMKCNIGLKQVNGNFDRLKWIRLILTLNLQKYATSDNALWRWMVSEQDQPWKMGSFFHIFKLAKPFKCQPHKMVKHTQTIRRQFTNELFECV